MSALELRPAAIDAAALVNSFRGRPAGADLAAFLEVELAEIIDSPRSELLVTDVVLYGFGRIGRLIARILVSHEGAGSGLRLRAIVVRGGEEGDLVNRASLLHRDSVNGPFDGTITIDVENCIHLTGPRRRRSSSLRRRRGLPHGPTSARRGRIYLERPSKLPSERLPGRILSY
ncbi:glyceraldehyde 3-phosphate dehydrogenase NAD-binding domain-containing protein [Frondihabitans sp. PhB188]|uniref:glyceraldehyde 3-phosphate dehydrogenase NAD-binding domain-containing protein n=1 Tax=Frondihabitans sp. PhB188 TaxID=2485200 RepID=UPI001F2D9D90|nr:glyceraldehyde 3-phosphate dehydrogenase NAD-binding domain-containing protein [Frondihabitans sp. PhB188]